MSKYYVVWVGRDPGVYDNWDDAHEQISGFPGARCKAFATQAEAVRAYRGDDSREALTLSHLNDHAARLINYADFPDIDLHAIAVDASCLGNPGQMEYRGVDLATGQEIFRQGPFHDATNNIGEYLALVHALSLCARTGDTRTIYSDSVTALAWLRNRRAKTTLRPTPRNQRLLTLLARADAWVQTHTWQNPVRKWNTDAWGEIPADFGRK